MRGFHVGACPEAVASDTSEMSKIEVELADTVENFMRCDVVGAFERNGNLVENYVGLIEDKTVT